MSRNSLKLTLVLVPLFLFVAGSAMLGQAVARAPQADASVGAQNDAPVQPVLLADGQSGPTPWGLWRRHAGNPIVDDLGVNGSIVKSLLTDINDPLRQPILYRHPIKGDKYWMAYAGVDSGPGIRLAYSSDLLRWEVYGSSILAPGIGEHYLSSPNLFKDGDTYYLVYDVALDSPHGSAQRIAYAAAPTPLGPWTKGPVMLDLGSAGEWDEGRVTEPGIFKDGDTYYMYYMGDALPPYGRAEQVGLATTSAANFPRGPWVKYGVVLPIHQSTTAWDRGLTADPNVIKVNNLYYMLYTGSSGDNNWKLAVAWASNPFGPWYRPASPALSPIPLSWESDALVRGMIVFHQGKYYLYYSAFGAGRFRVGVAIADPGIPLLEDMAVNVGGPKYVDHQGVAWEADRAYGSGNWGYVGEAGQIYTVSSPIAGTDDDPLYQTERYGMTQYAFDVVPGIYSVTLRFAEIYFNTRPGDRVFDVKAEGQTVIAGLDVMLAAGGRYIAVDRSFLVEVTDGQLNLDFVTRRGSAKVNAIRIMNMRVSPTPTPTAHASATPTATPSATSTPTMTPSVTATAAPSVTVSPTRSATATAPPSATVTPTMTPDAIPIPLDIYELNDTCALAYRIQAGSNYSAYISRPDDVDCYSLLVSDPNAYIWVELSNLPADYDLFLHQPDGRLVAWSNYGGRSDEYILNYPVAGVTGVYCIRVLGHDRVYDPYQSYRLYADMRSVTPTPTRTVTATPTSVPLDRNEPNNSFDQATQIAPGSAYFAFLDTNADVDYYVFSVPTTRTMIMVSLTQLPLDYDLYLADPLRNTVAWSRYGGNASEYIFYLAPIPGSYYLWVVGFDHAYDPVKPYRLMVQLN